MEHKARTKALSWLLSLVMILSLVPGVSIPAYAATLTNSSTTWSEDSTIEDNVTIGGKVSVTANMTLTIPEGKTLTVNGGINANGHTLTVDGAGTLNVTGANGGNGSSAGFEGNGGNGGNGSAGFTGTLVVDGAVVNVRGGNGGKGGNGGEFEGNGGNGGIGGYGVSGDVTVRSGSATVTGGNGGKGGSGGKAEGNGGRTGNPGRAVEGAITGNARESENNSTWSDVTNGTSTKQYVEVLPAHNHSFTYTASGATITATCTADNCPLDDGTEQHNHTATLTLKPPANLIYDGKAKAATVEGEIPGVETPTVIYKQNDTEINAANVKEKGAYTASVTLGEKTASVEFTIKDASYTITIPAKLTVENAGWNATAGVTASGEIAEGAKLTVTASSDGEFALVNQSDNTQKVGYKLAESGDSTTTYAGATEKTAWEFTTLDGTAKPMGIIVENYDNKPAGTYQDTVTFTAKVEIVASAGPKTAVAYSFDDANSPSLTAGSRVSFDYTKTSVITSTIFLNAYNNANGDPGASTISLGNTDLSGENWTLVFEWAANGGCNSKVGHTILKSGDTTLFDIVDISNWNTANQLTYGSSSVDLSVPACNKSNRFNNSTGDLYNTTDYWYHFEVTGTSTGVYLTVTNSSSQAVIVDSAKLSETNVNPTALSIEPSCGGAIGIDELSLTYGE